MSAFGTQGHLDATRWIRLGLHSDVLNPTGATPPPDARQSCARTEDGGWVSS